MQPCRHRCAEHFKFVALHEPFAGLGLLAHREVRHGGNLSLPLRQLEHAPEPCEVAVDSRTRHAFGFALGDELPNFVRGDRLHIHAGEMAVERLEQTRLASDHNFVAAHL